jgi:hypothetical protein
MTTIHRPPFPTSTKTVILLFLLFFASQLLIGMILGPVVGKDLGIMQTVAMINPQVFRDVTKNWGEDELKRFERHFIVDYWFHPLVYSITLAAWVCFEAERNLDGLPLGLPLHVIIPIIFLGGIFDVMENSIHYRLMPNLTQASDEDIRLAALFSNMKWLICSTTLIWCIRMSITRFLIARKNRNQTKKDDD